MSYYLTSECVSMGHPDKVADIISDTILDDCLRQDKNCRVACETMVTTGQVFLAGEITLNGSVNTDSLIRKSIRYIGYDSSEYQFDGNSCGIISALHKQSPDIAMGVDKNDEKEQGAGDQGMMFGYACNETPQKMPLAITIARDIINEANEFRCKNVNSILGPDAKSQVTVLYGDDNKPKEVTTIVVSHQHKDHLSQEYIQMVIKRDIINKVVEKYKELGISFDNCKYYINQTGKFVIGGPAGDTGLTGRKIIVDTYGGRCPHGGGAFSGKDPSKVDRSGAYACRHIAKNMVAAGICDEVTVQVSYCIGRKEPMSIHVDMNGTNKTNLTNKQIENIISETFDMTPYGIISRLKLKNPIYTKTAMYGHFGHNPYEIDDIEYYTWEKLDYVDVLKNKIKQRI